MSSAKYAAGLIAMVVLSGSVCVPSLMGGKPQLKDIKLPPGFTISVYAEGITNARAMCWG